MNSYTSRVNLALIMIRQLVERDDIDTSNFGEVYLRAAQHATDAHDQRVFILGAYGLGSDYLAAADGLKGGEQYGGS